MMWMMKSFPMDSPSAPEALLPARPSIFIVDDDRLNIRMLSSMLAYNGFMVFSETEGTKACSRIEETQPDLILLDIELGDVNGIDLCENFRKQPLMMHIPVIFLSGSSDKPTRLRGLSAGGVDYVTKPYDPDELLLRVKIHINNNRNRKYVEEAQRARLQGFRTSLQKFMTDPSKLPGAGAAVWYEPAEDAGGDLYDVLSLGSDVWAYLIADLSGHGNEVAFQSTILKALFRENASLTIEPEETFHRINGVLEGYLGDGMHATAAYLTLNRRRQEAVLVSAGHLPVLVCPPDGGIHRWNPEGDVIGAFDSPFFKVETRKVQTGTRIWMFSDGSLEDFSRRISWREGLESLEAQLPELNQLPVENAVEILGRRLSARGRGGDDRLLLVCEV